MKAKASIFCVDFRFSHVISPKSQRHSLIFKALYHNALLFTL